MLATLKHGSWSFFGCAALEMRSKKFGATCQILIRLSLLTSLSMERCSESASVHSVERISIPDNDKYCTHIEKSVGNFTPTGLRYGLGHSRSILSLPVTMARTWTHSQISCCCSHCADGAPAGRPAVCWDRQAHPNNEIII